MRIVLMRRIGILLLLWILFVNCKGQAIQTAENPQPFTETPTEVSSVETLTLSSTPEFFQTPLSPTQKVDDILRLYSENGSCELPCWWGIMPGKTSLQEVYNRFSTLGEFKNDTRSGDEYETVLFKVIPPREIDLYSMGEWTLRFVVSNGIVEGITTRSWYIKSFSNPTLANIIKAFGKPKEIWMKVSPRMIGPPFYELALFYPQQGILVFGKGDAQIISEQSDRLDLYICPQNMPVVYDVDEHYPMIFHLTSPGKNLSFTELNHSQLYNEPYTLLDNMLTDMNIEQFYEIYANPLVEECFNLSLRAR